MIIYKIRGIVKEKESGIPLPGVFIKAYDKDLLFDDLLGSAISDQRGRFEIVSEPEDFRDFFDVRPDIYFKVYRGDRRTLVHTTKDAVRWNARRLSELEILVPGERLHEPAETEVVLTGDDGTRSEEFGVGDSLTILARGLRPAHAYDIGLYLKGKELFTSRLLTNLRGEIEPTVLWPQMGFDDPNSDMLYTPDQALERWAGKTLILVLASGRKRIAEQTFRVAQAFTRPLVLCTDRDSRLLNGFEVGSQPLCLTLRNLPFSGPARIYMVPRRHEWRPGDSFQPAALRNGHPAVRDLDVPGGGKQMLVELAPADALLAGAYDFIVRPLRYGFEENEADRLLTTDVVGGRHVTGVVIRESFWAAKPVLGGCVNKIPVSGRSLAGAPYFRYTDTFEVGENVYAAIDPGIADPGNISKMCALYVIASKDDTTWNADNSLNHLPALGGNAKVQKIKVQAGCINANKVLVWPGAMQPGQYDLVADFGNNTPDAAAFVPDNAYNTPLDVIDGYFIAGFRVVEDPGTMQEFNHAGNWVYDENDVSAMGLSGTVSIDDENGFYATPGGFSVLTRQVQLKAHVFFPVDNSGVTDPAQISASKPDYPLVVIVHGNGHNYTSYDFQLQHLAMNGFIAASIDNRYLSGASLVHGMHGLGRANTFFQHLAVLKAKFGAKLQNNIGVMGHSRGGEAVVKIARLNQQLTLGNNINAVLSLAPTDQYGKEVFAGAFAKPYFVLYGSRDGDVAGWHPSLVSVPGFDWRMTGFSLYDRAADAPKSMAFVYRATHNGFITTNSDNPLDQPLPETAQQAITKAYTNAFFRRHLYNEPRWDGLFTGEWRPASVAGTGAEIYVQYRAPGGKVVDDFEGAVENWQSSTIGGSVSHGGTLAVAPSEARMFDYPPAKPGLDPKSPHDSRGLGVSWNNIGDRLTWTIPTPHKDVSLFSVLSLRVTQKEGSASNPVNQAQDFRVTLKDAANNQRAVRVSAFGAVPFPDQRSNSDLRKSAMTTIRIPLTSYTVACAGQPKVDLLNVVELSLDFSSRAAGEIEIDEIEFAN